MTDAQQTEQVKYQVLCVDDEQNILRAIKRALFSLDVDLTLADSGEKALAVMKEKPIHVVISDMKMPGMTGAELLEQVAAHYPDTFRVVLTGFADIDATIKAVNQGRIHRYLQKPWDNQELINTIEEGLERIKLKDENARLQKLTKLQNAKLKEVNNSLEQVVQKRTKQIKAALRRIEQRNGALEQVLFNVISINPDIDGKFAIEVSELATKLANQLECSKEETNVIRYACLIGELGLLGLKPEHYRPAFNKLSYQQQKNYLSQTKLAKTILAPAEHLREVSDILEYQFEYYNGAGLYKLVATQIPIGARILAVARDYWRMVSGRITGQPMTPIEARVELKKHRNTRYDGNVLDILLNTKDIDKPSYIENRLSTEELKPGMVLSKNLYNESHILLLPEGHVFTDATIAKLAQYEREHNRLFDIAVERNGMDDATIG